LLFQLSVDGDADAAVQTRMQIGWNKFRQLVPLFTNKDISSSLVTIYRGLRGITVPNVAKIVQITFEILQFFYF